VCTDEKKIPRKKDNMKLSYSGPKKQREGTGMKKKGRRCNLEETQEPWPSMRIRQRKAADESKKRQVKHATNLGGRGSLNARS